VLSRGEWKREILARGRCERCPNTERLHAHHKDHDSTNHTIENGECLCVWCHDEEHEAGGAIVALDAQARSDEGRAAVSAAQRKRHAANPDAAAVRRGTSNTPAHNAAISAAVRRQALSPAGREQRRLAGEASGAARRKVVA